MKLQLEGNKLIYHLDRLNQWKKGKAIYPLYLEIGPSRVCNQRCIHCYVDHLGFQNTILEEDILLKLIDDAGKMDVKGIQFSGCGEPLLNKALPKAIQRAHKKKISVALTTNGVLYTKDLVKKSLEGITWIRYSVLGCSPETYAKLHKVGPSQFDVLMMNIEDALAIRKKNGYKATIGIAMFLFKENVHEVTGFARKMKAMGVDYFAVKCPGYDPRNKYKPERGLEKDYEGTLKEIESLGSDKFKAVVRWDQFRGESRGCDLPAGCLSVDFMAVVDSDGNVYCCNGHWGNAEYCYGNLHDKSVIKIWNSKRRKAIAKKVKEKADHSACYCICRNYSVNKFLWDLQHPPEHVNLI